MTDLERKAVQRVFELLEIADGDLRDAKEILRQALAQPEQKIMDCVYPKCETAGGCNGPCSKPLYTASPKREWVGLTDDETDGLVHSATYMDETDLWHLVSLVEERLKEKNG